MTFPARTKLLTALAKARDTAQFIIDSPYSNDYERKQATHYRDSFIRQIEMVESWGDEAVPDLVKAGKL